MYHRKQMHQVEQVYHTPVVPAHTPVVPVGFDYSGPFRMTNSLFTSLTCDAHHEVSYMGDKHEFKLFCETTFNRTERIKKFLNLATQREAIQVSNLQL
jgi:hypothetical protein